jgi:hypothetical protein
VLPFSVRLSSVFLFLFRWLICIHYRWASLFPFRSAN